jgi:hypothetical protein
MIKENQKKILLDEAIRIADDIYDKRNEDENGLYWKTMYIDTINNSYSWEVSENIYSGNSGIILFYLGLYKLTLDAKYIEICKRTMSWIINYCEKNPTSNYSFLTGRLSVPYVLTELDKYLKNEGYLEIAIKIAMDCDSCLSSGLTASEFLNGAAGSLLSLLHLYDRTNNEKILDKIFLYAEYILDSAHYGDKGIHWDRSPQVIKSLCGFSHGASGIAIVFLELGRYFGNSAYYYIAEQAMKYESFYFDKEQKSWMDLRKMMFKENDEELYKKALLENNYAFFTMPMMFNAWCHGAPGIGLVRLRANNLLKKEIYKNELNTSIDAVLATSINKFNDRTSITLCHGTGGNLDLVIEARAEIDDENTFIKMNSIVDNLISYITNRKCYASGYLSYSGKTEDLSMFIGNAGIGYFFLRLIAPNQINSILCPILAERSTENILNQNTSIHILPELRKRFVKIVYERTVEYISICRKEEIDLFFGRTDFDPAQNEVNIFKEFTECILKLHDPKLPLLQEIFMLETEKYNLDNNIISYALLNAKQFFRNDIIMKILGDNILLNNAKLKISTEIKIIYCSVDWTSISVSDIPVAENPDDSETAILLIATVNGVMEKQIYTSHSILLDLFENETTVNDALDKYAELFDEDTYEGKLAVKDKALELVKIFLKEGLLEIK